MTRERWRVSAVIVLALALLAAVLIANGSSPAQAATPGDPTTEPTTAPVTTAPAATDPTTTAPTAEEPTTTAPTAAVPTTTPTTDQAPTAAAAASVPCEGYWKNFWFGANSVTGTVVISNKGKAGEHVVSFDVSSTATVSCTVYAQIFTYDGAGELPQTAVATTQIVLEPGQSKHVELTTNECHIQADLSLTKYDTIQWPGMNWDDYIASDVSTCPPPPPCQTSNGTTVQPGYAVLDGDHALVRSASDHPEKRAFAVYALAGTKAPADNNDLTNIALTLVQGMTLVGEPVMGTTDNCTSVPVPECNAFAIVEIDATTTPLPRVYLSVSAKALEILTKTGLDLTKLLDLKNLDLNAVIKGFSSLSQDDQNTLINELLNQPGLKMPFYSVNWFSVEACPTPPTTTTTTEAVAPAQEAAVLAASDTPTVAAATLPTTGSNTPIEVGFALVLVAMGAGLCLVARSRRQR